MAPASKEKIASPFGDLEKRLGYTFSSHVDLKRAITHASVRKQTASEFHYERLEFLGDRVLGLCVAELLHDCFPEAAEGELSTRLNALVRRETLADIADELQLHEFIRTGGDLKEITSKRMQSIRADVLEAIIAAIYRDGALEAARDFINRVWGDRLMDIKGAEQDSKTALQEWAHANRLATPKYSEKSRSGPDHDPVFTVSVSLPKRKSGVGTGRSKRLAEQAAAREILIREGVWKDEKGQK